MSDEKSIAGHSSDALRALISAASLVGAISLIYSWSAPWLVFLVDNWREFSDWAFGWVWFETTPDQRLVVTSVLILAGAQMASLIRAVLDLPQLWWTAAFPAFVWLTAAGFFVYASFSFTPTDAWVVASGAFMLVVYLGVTFLANRAFVIWLAVWLGLAFAIERVYRWGILDNIPTPG